MSNANLIPGGPQSDSKRTQIKDYNIHLPFSQPGGGVPTVIKRNPLDLNAPMNFLEETKLEKDVTFVHNKGSLNATKEGLM